MNHRRRQFLRLAAAAAALASASRIASAQTYPHKLIKLILPYTPGSPNDVFARLATPYLSAQLGQTIVIENRPGGGTTIGTRAVMTAAPDGANADLVGGAGHHVFAYAYVRRRAWGG